MKIIDQFPEAPKVREVREAFRLPFYLTAIACIILLGVASWIMVGCSTIQISSPDGYTASYTRWGDQQIQGFRLERDNLGVIRVVLEKQSSDARILDAIGALVGAAR